MNLEISMRKYQFEIVLALALAIIFAAFWWWQTPGSSGKLTGNEVDAYIQRIAPNLPLEPGEKAEVLARFRAWGQADDGDPVYMLNVMRYFDQLKRIPGAEAIKGTPAQANAHYEDAVLPILTRLGAYPLVGGPGAPTAACTPTCSTSTARSTTGAACSSSVIRIGARSST
jgi:hypothetical protein